MKRGVLSICIMAVLIVTLIGIGGQAHGDAILFPFVTMSNTVATLITIVNTAGLPYSYDYLGIPFQLHYEYWYKQSTNNSDQEKCTELDFMRPTSANDIVTFDATGNINSGQALFNDSSPYNTGSITSFHLPVEKPRRAFLIVDNNTSWLTDYPNPPNGFIGNVDGTLYGEALILNLASGDMWGYTAYNARGGGVSNYTNDPVFFSDGMDYEGEVIGPDEKGKTVFLPQNEYLTRYFVTPVGIDINGQRTGNANSTIQLLIKDSDGNYYGGMYDNDENPISFTQKVNVVCTGALSITDLIPSAALNYFLTSQNQMWGYLGTDNGTVTNNPTSQAIIGKLEYNENQIDLSFNAECSMCKNKWTKCTKQCEDTCASICALTKSVIRGESDFKWIRSSQSLP